MKVYAIYVLFISMFAPAGLMFVAGLILIPMVVIMDLLKGHFSTMLFLLPLIGGAIGLFSVIVLTTEIAGDPIAKKLTGYARAGLLVGVAAESAVYFYVKPESTPSLTYWLPPIIGAVILFLASVAYTANKSKHAEL